MSLNKLIQPFPWSRYSKKVKLKIQNGRSMGILTEQEAKERGVRFVQGEEGKVSDGNYLRLMWFVDKEDGIIIDLKYQVFGETALIAAAESAAELMVGKNYDQARRLTTDLIDKNVRDKESDEAFPKETHPHLNLVLSAIDACAEQCTDLPLPTTYVAMPHPNEIGEVLEGGYPGYLEMPLKKKLALIEEVLDRDLRPYIALDAGGVEVINLINGLEVVIAYTGSCTSCYSSVGTTLSYIQQVFRAKVHPDIKVTPNIDWEQFNG
ncbi:MAG: iron-sulfur cluster assembly scaffold protein [Chlamydiia bacterium]|nr:iron-sulfur cluster assembly scaffold protein [Chlamydiia bacterium]